jgi:hypothetical protein
MGIIEGITQKGLSAVGLGGIFERDTDPKGYGADFPEGMTIEEFIDGKPNENPDGKILLIGSFLPLIPFEHGGRQQIVKDFYPGNQEPVVQVLGARENDVTIKGVFKTKRFSDDSEKENSFAFASKAAYQYQELVEAMRRRGNVVKITLGNWVRYGFIEEGAFKLNRVSHIEYSISFSIMGRTMPKNCKMIDGADDDLEGPNNELINAAANALANTKNYPETMPRTLSEFIDDLVSGVASAINLVTNFVDKALKDIENLVASANRAIGLIKNARATIARFSRRIGALQLSVANLASGISFDGFKTAAQLNNAAHVKKVKNNYLNLAKLLAVLQARFASLARTIPLRRHLVKKDETLQALAIKYYNNADLWKTIYDHNKLSTPQLVVGSVLEIPRA